VALKLCATLRPDIVVTDLAMPDEDGVWLAEQLRARGERNDKRSKKEVVGRREQNACAAGLAPDTMIDGASFGPVVVAGI
jgi:CheY-like chemotaxis protein